MNRLMSGLGTLSVGLTGGAVLLFTVAAVNGGDAPWWFYAGLWLMGVSTMAYVIWTAPLLNNRAGTGVRRDDPTPRGQKVTTR